MKGLLRKLTLPKWRLGLRVLAVVLLVAVGLGLGIWWGFLIPIGLLLMWAFYYDYSHKPRGGWRPAPMGSFAAINNVDPTFLINERGDSQVDPTGRTYGGPSRVPTPEEQAATDGGSWQELLWMAAELVVLAGLIFLAVQVAQSARS